MVCPLFLKFDLPFCLLFSFHFSFVRMYCNVRCFSSSVIHYFFFCVLDVLYINWFSLVVLFSCTSWKTVVGLYLLGGLYLSFYRFFCASLPTFSVGLFRFSFVKFNIIQGCVFVNTFLKIFLFIFIIFTQLLYFYNFRHISMYYLSFLKRKGKGRAAAGGTCNEPCQHPSKALTGFRRMTAVAV